MEDYAARMQREASVGQHCVVRCVVLGRLRIVEALCVVVERAPTLVGRNGPVRFSRCVRVRYLAPVRLDDGDFVTEAVVGMDSLSEPSTLDQIALAAL